MVEEVKSKGWREFIPIDGTIQKERVTLMDRIKNGEWDRHQDKITRMERVNVSDSTNRFERDSKGDSITVMGSKSETMTVSKKPNESKSGIVSTLQEWISESDSIRHQEWSLSWEGLRTFEWGARLKISNGYLCRSLSTFGTDIPYRYPFFTYSL